MDKRDVLPRGILDKGNGEDTSLSGCGSGNWPSPIWLLVGEIMLRSQFHCYSALILYVFIVYSSNSQVDFCCFFDNNLDPIPYTLWSLFYPSLFYFISFFRTSRLTALDSSNSKSDSFLSSFSPSFVSESLSFTLFFQNYIPDLSSVLLVSNVVLNLLSPILGCALRNKLASDFLFL